jgi:pSer/pThr/pTyr-binding forkhead associated (FHA) protein
MSAQLVPLSARTAPTISLLKPVLLVGRHAECDVRIDLPQISRRHCCVALADDRVLIRDLGSRNGLRVNGRLIDEARIYPGDEVAIGPLLYRYEVEGQATARPPRGEPQADPNDPDLDLIPLDDK